MVKWKVSFERLVDVQRRSGYTERVDITIVVPRGFKPTGLAQVTEE